MRQSGSQQVSEVLHNQHSDLIGFVSDDYESSICVVWTSCTLHDIGEQDGIHYLVMGWEEARESLNLYCHPMVL